MLWRTRYSPIGIDIGSRQVKLVQLVGTGAQYTVHQSAVAPLAHEGGAEATSEQIVHCLRSLLTDSAFVGTRVVSALPGEAVDIRILHIPLPVEPQALPDVIRQEAEAYLPYSPKDAMLAHLVAGEEQSDGETQRRVIVVATPRQHVDSHLALLQAAGLHCLAIEVLPLALSRLLRQQRVPTATPLLVADLGCRYSTAFVLWQDVLMYSRTLPWGGRLLTQAVMKDLKLSYDKAESVKQQHGFNPQTTGRPMRETGQSLNEQALAGLLWEIGRPHLEALAQELERIVSYWGARFRGALIDRLCLSGGSAALPGLDDYLRQRMGINISLVEPWRQEGAPGTNGQGVGQPSAMPPALAPAVGLALRGIPTHG